MASEPSLRKSGESLSKSPQREPLADKSLQDVRARAFDLAQLSSEQTRINLARSFCIWAVNAYWNELGIQFRLPELPSSAAAIHGVAADVDAITVAKQLGRLLATLSASNASYHLGSTYAGMLPDSLRSERGMFFTPPVLVDRLLDQAEESGVNWATASILDPAAGAGAFLVPLARRMTDAIRSADSRVAIQNISARLQGWEIDPFSAWLSEVFISAELRGLLAKCGRKLGRIVRVTDSLLAPLPRRRFDLVVGNPPFGRLRLAPAQRARFSRSLYGHANLYGLFVDLAVRLASAKGLISFLTPASFLAGEYFKNLRAVLSESAPPTVIDFVDSRKNVFQDVLQETVLATYRRDGGRQTARVHFIRGFDGRFAKLEAAGRFNLPKSATEPWVLPRTSAHIELAAHLRRLPSRLEHWGYSVSTGPLVWNRHKPQLRAEWAPGCIPLIWAESVTSDGRFVLRADKRNHQPYFMPKRGDDWLIVSQPCVLLQRTTAKEQARRLISAEMPASIVAKCGGVTIENHLNMVIPETRSPKVSPTVVAAFLNCATTDQAFRCISGSVAVSAYELEALPIPSLESLGEFCHLVQNGAAQAILEAEVERLYGIAQE